jgi:hypothetical protein
MPIGLTTLSDQQKMHERYGTGSNSKAGPIQGHKVLTILTYFCQISFHKIPKC